MKSDYYVVKFWQKSEHFYFFGPERVKASGFLQQKTDVVMTKGATIEEGLKQKTRQNVVVLDWGSRSHAALGNFGVKV